MEGVTQLARYQHNTSGTYVSTVSEPEYSLNNSVQFTDTYFGKSSVVSAAVSVNAISLQRAANAIRTSVSCGCTTSLQTDTTLSATSVPSAAN